MSRVAPAIASLLFVLTAALPPTARHDAVSVAFAAGVVPAGSGIVAPGAGLTAADLIFGPPHATAEFGKWVRFDETVGPANVPVRRIEILIDQPGDLGPSIVQTQGAGSLASRLHYQLKVESPHLLPNTKLTARWRIVDVAGRTRIGPAVSVTYADSRFSWHTKAGPELRVHWYQGSASFGDRALEIGEQAIARASKLLGVRETRPIDFFIYGEKDAFYDALGPGTRGNVGGLADSTIRTLFALITPRQIDLPWVGTVVPHELTHLVFHAAVDNPYDFPPAWLNEGLAVYLSEGYGPADRARVAQAVAAGSLIPLEGLTGEFPTTRDAFFLAYAESVSTISYFIHAFGQRHLVELVRSYRAGVTNDEAFRKGLGMSVAEFEAGWLGSLHATVLDRVGPQPAPAGPVPPAWSGSGVSSAGEVPSASAIGGAGPGNSGVVSSAVAEQDAGPAVVATSAPMATIAAGDPPSAPPALTLAFGGGLVLVIGSGILVVLSRRSRRRTRHRTVPSTPPVRDR